MEFNSENLLNDYSEKNYNHSAELVKMLQDFCSNEKEMKECLQILEKDYLKQYMGNYYNVINGRFQENQARILGRKLPERNCLFFTAKNGYKDGL